jgi:L-threonylcarbamoyladenylate synthase
VHALDRAAVLRLFEAKGRPANDPLIVHVDAVESIQALVATCRMGSTARIAASGRPADARAAAVLAVPMKSPRGCTPSPSVCRRIQSRAPCSAAGIPSPHQVRISSRGQARPARRMCWTTSPAVSISSLTVAPRQVGVESTVLDLSGEAPTILRPGAVSIDMLREILPRVERRSAEAPSSGAMKSPGLLERHYSPRAPLTVYDGSDGVTHLVRDACTSMADGQRLGIMVADEDRDALVDVVRHGARATIAYLGSERDLATVASRLYAVSGSSMRPASIAFSCAAFRVRMALLLRYEIA